MDGLWLMLQTNMPDIKMIDWIYIRNSLVRAKTVPRFRGVL